MAHEEYVRNGKGDRAVLFIHGFLGSPEHFEPYIKLIPEDYGIYNILLCGHGGTVRDFSKASMEIWKGQTEDAFLQLRERYKEIIIVAHSMGTLFAYSLAVKYPQNIKALLLLGTPLAIGVRCRAFVNTVKTMFGMISDDDEVGMAYLKAHSVKLNMRLWEYLGWIPRYIELFRESKNGRKNILGVNVPCFIFQSAKDELVSRKSEKYIPRKDNITLTILENSAHFIYDKNDMDLLKKIFLEII